MDQTQLRAPDLYGRTHQMDERTLEVMVERLEGRGRHPFFLTAIGEYMDQLALAGPEALLDLGCGTGVAARTVARRTDLTGPITAIDISDTLIAVGRRLAEAKRCGARIEFRAGDAHGLGLPEASFDVVLMHTLVSHVADPASVLAEGRRLLKPGSGRLVVFDGDYESLTFATDAADGGEATDVLVRRTLVANPRVMRAMPGLLARCGFELVWSRAYIAADIGRVDFWAPGVASLRALLPKADAMSEAEAGAFVDGLDRASAENRFFAASNFYGYVARRFG